MADINSLTGRKVLVTGAGGFIGSHLTEALVGAGAEVTAMVHYNSGSLIGNLAFLDAAYANQIRIVSGNIEDSDFMMHVMKGQEIVFHLAALIAIPYSYVAPRSYRADQCRRHAERARGGAASGHRARHPYVHLRGLWHRAADADRRGASAAGPVAVLGLQDRRRQACRELLSFVRHAGVTVRPFNTFGPRQSARAFIPTIISQALVRDEIRLGSLTPERDMTFVTDTASGFIAAATAPGIEGMTINLGTGETRSVGWFAERILSLMGIDKPIVQEQRRIRPELSEVRKLVSDNSLARKVMGWSPKVTIGRGAASGDRFCRGEPRPVPG